MIVFRQTELWSEDRCLCTDVIRKCSCLFCFVSYVIISLYFVLFYSGSLVHEPSCSAALFLFKTAKHNERSVYLKKFIIQVRETIFNKELKIRVRNKFAGAAWCLKSSQA